MKRCACCKQYKSYDCFCKNKHRKDGHYVYCRDCVREKQDHDIYRQRNAISSRRYRAKHISQRMERQRKWRMEYPEIVHAHVATRFIKHRPGICQKCGATENIEGHHPDYSQPRIVIWLCKRCHKKIHKEIADIEKPQRAKLKYQGE